MPSNDLKQKVETLSNAKSSFYLFVKNVFAKSFTNFIDGKYIKTSCNYLQKYDRTMKTAFRSGFKSTNFYAYVMSNIMFRGIKEDLDIRYFSYNQDLAGWHIQQIKAHIVKNPFFAELINYKPLAENIIACSWDRKHIVRVRPQGIVSFSRGLKSDIILCVPGDTRIECKGESKTIRNVKVGDLVKTHKNRYRKVTKKFERPFWGYLYELSTKHSKLDLTSEHRILASRPFKNSTTLSWRKPIPRRGRIRDNQLKTGDRLHYPIKYKESRIYWSERKSNKGLKEQWVTKDFAWWMGLYAAEGSCTKGKIVISLGAHETNLIERTRGLMIKFFKKSWMIGTTTSKQIISQSNGISLTLKKLFGTNALEKRIPEQVFNWDIERKTAFFIGLIDGDGHYFPSGAIRLKISSKQLFNDTIKLLATLGVSPTIGKPQVPKSGYGLKNLQYTFFLNAIDSNKLKTIYENSFEISQIRKKRNQRRDHKVYNLEVEEDNTYIANGFIVHNCDDILSDPTNPIHPTVILKINDIFKSVILESIKPGGEIHIIGSPLSRADLYFNPEIQKEFHYVSYPAIEKDNDGNEVSAWPEFYTLEQIKAKIPVMGEKAFQAEMMCLEKGTQITVPTGVKKIDGIKMGDIVLGQTGFTKVIQTFERKAEKLLEIKFNNQTITLTPEHPILCVDSLTRKKLVSTKGYIIIPRGDYYYHQPKTKIKYIWKKAEEIQQGDLVLFPLKSYAKRNIDTIDISPFISAFCKPSDKHIIPIPNGSKWARTKELANKFQEIPKQIKINNNSLRLFGHYVAEGFSGYYPDTNRWRFGIASIKENIRKEFAQEFKDTFGIHPTITKSEIVGDNPGIASFLGNAFGHTAREKHFPDFLLNLDFKNFIILFESMFEGDGYFEPKSKEMIYTSYSKNLCNQLFTKLSSLGIRSSFGHHNKKDATFIRITKDGVKKLYPYLLKNKKGIAIDNKPYFPQLSFINSNFILTRVKNVKTKKGNFPVYNIHTADNTYVAGRILVHNCEPYYSTDSFFKKEQLRKTIVNKNLRNLRLIEGLDTSNLVIAGLDIGKKKHPSAFSVFEIKDRKAIMVHHKVMRKWPYYTAKPFVPIHPSQVEYCKEAIKNFGIDVLYYDNTRGEFEGAKDSGLLTPAFITIVLTPKMRLQIAVDFEKIVLNKQTEFLDDEEMLNSICSVTNDLVSIATQGSHGDDFWSIALAMIGFQKFGASGKADRQIRTGAKSIFEKKAPPAGW